MKSINGIILSFFLFIEIITDDYVLLYLLRMLDSFICQISREI